LCQTTGGLYGTPLMCLRGHRPRKMVAAMLLDGGHGEGRLPHRLVCTYLVVSPNAQPPQQSAPRFPLPRYHPESFIAYGYLAEQHPCLAQGVSERS